MVVGLQIPLPDKLTPRVDFKPNEFARIVATHGLRLSWEMAAECPCQRIETMATKAGGTREPRTDCSACAGKGYIHHSPQSVRGVVSSARANPDRFRVYGEYAAGMVSISVASEQMPAFLDRYTMLDSIMIRRETRTRTTAGTEKTRYPIVVRTMSLLRGTPATPTTVTLGVLYARKAYIDGQVGPQLIEGTDFSVVSDGGSGYNIQWIASANAPTEGERYSIAYYANPSFIVQSNPHTFRDTWFADKLQGGVAHSRLPVSADCWLEGLGERA